MPFAEELDTDLGASLARARRLAQMKEKAKNRKARDIGEVRCAYSTFGAVIGPRVLPQEQLDMIGPRTWPQWLPDDSPTQTCCSGVPPDVYASYLV